jgi:aspartate/methionine/tyrosine aminotransferase
VLNVSPFIFHLIAESGKTGIIEHARSTSVANREVLRKALFDGPAVLVEGGAVMSVGWVRLPEGWDCFELCVWLQERGIGVLPGAPFFWNAPEQGRRFIRIALMRTASEFDTGATMLAKALVEYSLESSSGRA